MTFVLTPWWFGFGFFIANLVGWVATFVLAFRHNRERYGDSDVAATLWALALVCIWPLTLVAWAVFGGVFDTPFSSRRSRVSSPD